ncbi:uncharacterized protein LOC143922986 isoform X2 [Arctopsyche grandis]|uniref:uncharacterized protein LOC143922986 isoform X2 n=1 Tax=Arctopsyche grandis TaxID=121162 RepID=UPI00406D8D99
MEDMVKKLIFTKLTNSYTCPLTFNTTYPCACCNDRFALKSSYECHINRASVKITLFCKQCNAKLLFTNRCLMFLHMESHDNKEFKYSLADFTIEPIPIEMMKTNLIPIADRTGPDDLLKKYGIASSSDEPKDEMMNTNLIPVAALTGPDDLLKKYGIASSSDKPKDEMMNTYLIPIADRTGPDDLLKKYGIASSSDEPKDEMMNTNLIPVADRTGPDDLLKKYGIALSSDEPKENNVQADCSKMESVCDTVDI